MTTSRRPAPFTHGYRDAAKYRGEAVCPVCYSGYPFPHQATAVAYRVSPYRCDICANWLDARARISMGAQR